MPIPQLSVKKSAGANNKQKKELVPEKKPGSAIKKDKSRFRRFAKIALIVIGICFLVGVIFMIGIFAWFSRDLPDPDKINERSIAQSTRIYDRTGEILLYEIHGDTNRTLVKLEDIPQYCRDATIATEDANFYKHIGFDIKGLFRAVVARILGWSVTGGGSTITQQFVKNSILTDEHSLTRKAKELILAIEMERKFTKDQILQLYLNEIPYGSTSYGIESASQAYFGKSVQALNLAECATLAALPQRPSYYANHKDVLLGRQGYVIGRMYDLGYISESEKNTALEQTVEFKKNVTNIKAPHFVFYIKDILSEKYGTKKVEQGGLKVITTIDMSKQEKAEEAINEYGDKNQEKYNASNAALVAIDPKTGQILAMVGSKDYFNDDIDGQVNVAARPRQPGSSFKPFVYLTAFAMGYTPETILFDSETDFGGTPNYHPHDYDWGERGPLQMQKALAGSLNIPAVKTLYLVGVENAVKTAEKFGYTTFTNKGNYGLAMVLGGVEVTLLEHTSAFATLASEGERHPAVGILKVEDSKGKTLEEWQNSSEQVFDKISIQRINKILSTDSLRAFIFGSNSKLTLSGRPVAAKTGTTNDFKDGWTMGFTPSLAAGVWAGNNNNDEMKNGSDGVFVAAPIWNYFMQSVLEGTEVEEFPTPPAAKASKPILRGEVGEEVVKKVDKFTEEIIPDECLASYPAEYIKDKAFKEVHNILKYVIKEDPAGPAPTNPENDPMYENWEKAIRLWAEGQEGYLTDKTPKADCGQRNPANKPSVEIKSPKNGSSYTNDDFKIDISYKLGSGRSLSKIDYYIDTTLIDTKTTSPFVPTFEPTNLTSGKHSLRVVVYDDKNNFNETSSSFTFSNTLLGEFYFSNPANNSSYKKGKAFKINFFLENPQNVASLNFYIYKQDDQNNQTNVFSSTSPIENEIEFSSPKNLGTGIYFIYVKIIAKNKEATNSSPIQFSITE